MLKPLESCTFPSLHDGTSLCGRIYAPKDMGNISDTCKIKAAIIAHPYGPLGGSQDDHVVLEAAETLLQRGFTVGTFNFR